MGKIRAMIDHAVAIANDDSHGYSWADRWNVDRDCSSLMYDSADAAGCPVGRGPDKTRYTGTMIDDFTSCGFTLYNYGDVDLRPGDILLRDPWGSGGHTEMYIGDGLCVGAHIAETGGVYGEPGDQTGDEISVTPNYGNWWYILRPPSDTPEQPPSEPYNGYGLNYRAHVQDAGWLPWVHDGMISGTEGYSARLEALQVKPPAGVKLRALVHSANVGWQTFDNLDTANEVIIGSTGKAQAIEMVAFEVVENTTGKKLEYRVHQAFTGWKEWTRAPYATGTDGMALRLEAIQMRLVD